MNKILLPALLPSCFAVGVIAFGLIAPSAVFAAEPTNYLFVGDLNTGTLLRYNADLVSGSLALTPYGLNGNTADAAYITGQGVTEGVHGTGDTLITSQHLNGQWNISRFDRFTGAFINYVTPQIFQGIGNIALTNDAKTVYVPDEAGNRLYAINVATGAVINSVAMSGVHDVQIGPDGFIYAAAYGANSGVRRYSADLTSFSQIIAPSASPGNANTLYRPAGMVISGNTLYVAQNILGTGSSVFKYQLNGSSAATFDSKVSSSLLTFTFGMEEGPDGDLYIAVPGTFGGQSGQNRIVKVDLASNFSQSAVTAALTYPGTNPSSTYINDDTNVIWPKYIKFSTNFAQANDPGNPLAAPEPGSLALLLPLMGVVKMVLKRRKSQK
jgi:hypothetical protein